MAAVQGTMKAAIVHEHGEKFTIADVAIPTPGPTEVLVRIATSGLCHTDVHAVDGDWPVPSKLPLIPGHEGAGTVVAIGSAVTTCKVGDRVGIAWLHSACGKCDFCMNGDENLCPKQQNSGYSVDGCFGEYALGEASHVAHIPDNLCFIQAAPILCAGVTTYRALKETEVRPGKFVAIIGAAGGLGHLAIQYAAAMGMRVIAIDMPDKLEFCASLGAETTFNATDPETPNKIVELTGGGCQGVLCVAASLGAFHSAIAMSRRGGTVVLVGLPKGAIPLPIFDCVLRGITVRGSIVGTRHDLDEALDFAARGKIKCQIETHSFSTINDVFDRLRKGQLLGRSVLEFSA